MTDQQFVTPSAGQGDWDASLNADLGVLERGYHFTQQAGVAINTGHVVWINSGGFAFPFNPNSDSINPHGLAFTAGSSGDTMQFLAWGIVRSLGITSPAIPGFPLFVSCKTPGVIVTSYGGANRPIGIGLPNGVLFRPNFPGVLPEMLTSSISIAAVTGSLHTFTVDKGRWGINRQTSMLAASADLVELAFYSDAARTKLLYKTISGGVSAVGSFQDRALWPYDNTDAVNSSAIYGTLMIMSAATVGSDDISVRGIWDRSR